MIIFHVRAKSTYVSRKTSRVEIFVCGAFIKSYKAKMKQPLIYSKRKAMSDKKHTQEQPLT